MLLVVVATATANLLGDIADRLPETLEPVPPACVEVPGPEGLNFQAGYCP